MEDKYHKHLKCRFCDFLVPKYRKLKDGRFRSGWNILESHIESNHPEDYERLVKWWEDYQENIPDDVYSECDWAD